jgi:fucose permease
MRTRHSLLLVALAYLSFISIGLPDGLLGVAWPSIRAGFGIRHQALGELLVMATAGYLLSSFSSGRVLARMSVGTLLALSCLTTAVSLFGYSVAPWWRFMAALGFLAGLGAGAIDAGLNTYAATRFSARVVNWLHGFYGIGATLGPIIMTNVLMAGLAWQRGYAIVAGWQLALALAFAATRRLWQTPGTVERHSPPRVAEARATLRLPPARLGIAVFFVYTGLEAAAGAWAFTLFTESRGVGVAAAGISVSAYWGCLTAGRFLSGFLVAHAPPRRILRGCMLGAVAGAMLLWQNISMPLSFLGLGLLGLCLAPVFPTLIAATPARVGEAHTANAVGFQIGSAALGQSLLPALVGVLVTQAGLESIGAALLVSAAGLVALYEALEANPSARGEKT